MTRLSKKKLPDEILVETYQGLGEPEKMFDELKKIKGP